MLSALTLHTYLTRRALQLSEAEWNASAEEEKAEYIEKELWVADKLAAWEAELAASSGAVSKSGKEKKLERAKKKGPLGHVGMLE